jgi:enediyne biosynthesis protein E4
VHFGLGKATTIDSLKIVWPGGREKVLFAIKTDQTLTVREPN